MVIKLWTMSQLKDLNGKGIPEDVIKYVRNILFILDKNYGCDRNVNDYGGYIKIFTNIENTDISKKYYQELKNFKLNSDESEFRDEIVNIDNKIWWAETYILNSEYGIVLIL